MNTNFLLYGGAVLLLFAFVSGQGDSQTFSQQSDATETATVGGRIEAEYRESQKALAESRFESGLCLLANQPIAPSLAVATPVPNGSIICDRAGTTAIADEHGRLTQIAKTDNRETIEEGLK
ncbi:MAG: hypothetical protein J7647_27545 [Cyanobacteria bacterium SBLK]|nr:hypothetical protein [Cyanobacteria bacterium SBLK]